MVPGAGAGLSSVVPLADTGSGVLSGSVSISAPYAPDDDSIPLAVSILRVVRSTLGAWELRGRRTGITTPMNDNDFRVISPDVRFVGGHGGSAGGVGEWVLMSAGIELGGGVGGAAGCGWIGSGLELGIGPLLYAGLTPLRRFFEMGRGDTISSCSSDEL